MPVATTTSNKVGGKRVFVPWEIADETYVLPEGKYLLRIQEATGRQAQSGLDCITIKYLVMKPDKFKGRTTSITYVFNGPGLRSLREVVTAVLGETPKKASDLDLGKLEGKLIVATAGVREGKNGGKFQELRGIERYGKAPEPEPEEDDEGLDLEDEDVEDDDLPF